MKNSNYLKLYLFSFLNSLCHCEERQRRSNLENGIASPSARNDTIVAVFETLNNYLKLGVVSIIVLAMLLVPVRFYAAAEDETAAVESQNTISQDASNKISLDLKNIDIVEFLRVISLKTGRTIVPSKGVSGRVTIYLNNVDFDDVLEIILRTQELALNKKGEVYYIMTEGEYKKMYGKDYIDNRKVETVKISYAKPSVIFNAISQLKSDVGKIVVDETSGTIVLIDIPEKLEMLKETIAELDRPLSTTVYNLDYAKAADAKTQLSAAITQGTGEVIVDERSGKAIVTDLPGKMKKINLLVREIDEASRQVYVEADIVELTLSDQFQRGIDWSKLFSEAVKNGITFSGYFPLALTSYQTLALNTTESSSYAVIQFLNTYGKTNIISQPRIAVVNNEEANLMVGIRDAYITQTQSQATSTTVTSESVEFVDVGVKLKIVPRIGSDDYITMKIKPEVSSVAETITTALGSRIPIVQTSQSESVVKIKDGATIMIAGMIKSEEIDAILGWPILSKIPLLGIAFGSRDKTVSKTEVIIFLTPHIMKPAIDLTGGQIKQIVPKEYLPEHLQMKVNRDEAIDAVFLSAAKPEPKPEPMIEKVTFEPVSPTPPEETADDYYQKGLQAKAGSNLKDAKAYFLKAVQLDNNLPAAYNNLGIIYEQEGKPKKAEEMYLKAVSVDPQYVPAYSNLALFNEGRGDSAKALAFWRKRVLYGNPSDEWTKKAIQRIRELEW